MKNEEKNKKKKKIGPLCDIFFYMLLDFLPPPKYLQVSKDIVLYKLPFCSGCRRRKA